MNNSNTINHGIQINPTVNPIQTMNIESIINLHVIVDYMQNIYNKTSVKITQISQQFTQLVQELHQQWWHPQEYYQQGSNFLYTYRYRFLAAALAALYGTCYYKLYSGQRYLASKTAWSMWQNRYSTETLCALAPDQLASNLMHDIQMEYATHANPTDFITPMVQFLTAIHAELAACKQMLIWHTWLSRLRLCRLFPGITCSPDELQDRIERLKCIKNIFLHWIATYNIEHNKYVQNAPYYILSKLLA
jgi:hypothetical protein